MKKRLFLIICLFVFIISRSENVELYIFTVDCNGNVILFNENCNIYKDSIYYATVFDKDDYPLLLPDTGKYILESMFLPERTLTFYVNKNGVFRDTIKTVTIAEGFFWHKKEKGTYWLCFDKKCNGYQADYYNNGKIYIEGFFRKGRPKGEVRFYRPDGTLERIEFYKGKYNKGKALKHAIHFDENGDVIGSY